MREGTRGRGVVEVREGARGERGPGGEVWWRLGTRGRGVVEVLNLRDVEEKLSER